MSPERVLEWLASRQPAPPPVLARRLAEVVTAAPSVATPAESMAVVMGDLGLLLLWGVERCGPQEEGVALDLLAADAFVTYAFEAAAEEGTEVEELVERLLAEVKG